MLVWVSTSEQASNPMGTAMRMSPGSWTVDWARMVGTGGQESFLCRHCCTQPSHLSKEPAASKAATVGINHWLSELEKEKNNLFTTYFTCQLKNPKGSCLTALARSENSAIDTWLHCLCVQHPWLETPGFMGRNILGAEPSTLDEVFIHLYPRFPGGNHKRVS